MTTVAMTTDARSSGRVRRRKGLISAHVISAVGLLGVDLAVLTLSVAGWRGADPRTVYPAAYLLGAWLLLPLAVAAEMTGIAVGLTSRWGLVRHWWVATKLALNTAGLVLGALVLVPALRAAAHPGNAFPSLHVDGASLVKDVSAAITVLTASVLLSVYKPFGPIRRTSHGSRPSNTASPESTR